MPIGIKGFQKGKNNWSVINGPWNKNKKTSEKTKKKLSESHKGYIMPQSQKDKISNANKGKKKPPRTEEHRRKLGDSKRGKKQSEETIEKRRISRQGYRPSKETRKKMSVARTGQKQSDEHRRKNSESHIGRIVSEETRKKQSLARRGSGNSNWIGGISNNPYPSEFNSVLKLKIRQRDNFICCLCGRTEREELEELNRILCVNHIDFNKNNCKETNLNTLCLRCNVKINKEREYWTNYFNTINYE